MTSAMTLEMIRERDTKCLQVELIKVRPRGSTDDFAVLPAKFVAVVSVVCLRFFIVFCDLHQLQQQQHHKQKDFLYRTSTLFESVLISYHCFLADRVKFFFLEKIRQYF